MNPNYVAPFSWLKSQLPTDGLKVSQCQVFLCYYQLFEYLAGRPVQLEELRAGGQGFFFRDLEAPLSLGTASFFQSLGASKRLSRDQESLARKALFLALTTTEQDWQALSPSFDLWYLVQAGSRQVELSPQDQAKLSLIYESALEKDYVVKAIGDKRFVLTEREARKLTDRQVQTLEALSREAELANPVYVTVGEKGVLLID